MGLRAEYRRHSSSILSISVWVDILDCSDSRAATGTSNTIRSLEGVLVRLEEERPAMGPAVDMAAIAAVRRYLFRRPVMEVDGDGNENAFA